MPSAASPASSNSLPPALVAVARCVVPHAFDESPDAGRSFLDDLARRLDVLPPHVAADLRLAARVFDSPVAGLLTRGLPRPFTALPPARRAAVLASWATSALPLRRTIHQGLRRFVLAVWYARPEAHLEIGYRGPMHERGEEERFAWEGAMEGVEREDEPVARGAATGGRRTADGRAARDVPRSVPFAVRRSPSAADPLPPRTDILVIGTGAGGAVAACRLAERGREVVVLEKGALWRSDEYTEREAEMTTRLYADAGARATDDLALSLFQGEAVGGSTTVNWMVMLRTPDWVLDEWRRDHGAVGLSPAELRPVFERVEREVHSTLVPDDAHSPNNRLLLEGARRLGWAARAAHVNARGCVRSGFCGQGCRHDAKQGTQLTYLPRALAAGATLVTGARAVRIEVVERAGAGNRLPLKRVTVERRDRAGRLVETGTIEARTVVVAAGAIETPALLLRSRLGGEGTGHWLRLHPTTPVMGLYDEDVYAAGGIPLSVVVDEHLRPGGQDHGWWIECPPVHPALAAVATSGFGSAHRALMREYVRMGAFIALVRDGADRALSNGLVRVDRAGRTRIRYRLGPTDRLHVAHAVRSAARLHLAAGAREVRTLHAAPVVVRAERDLDAILRAPVGPNRIALFSAHVNGTARFGPDRRSSACDPEGRVRNAPGVWVADGSLLPTAPGVNPQETIMALATVVAERIAAT